MAEISRRKFLGSASSGLALAGIGAPFATPASGQAKPDLKGRKLTHWDFLSPEGKSAREIAIKEIEGKFRDLSGVEVNYQIMPWQELGTKLLAAVQAGNPPESSRVNFFHLKMILLGNGLQELDPLIEKSFSEKDKEDFLVDFSPAMIVKGKKWSMQIEAVPKALFIRKDWLAQAGMEAPKTWNEFVEVGKKMTQRGRWGYMFGASKTQLNQLETIFQPQIQGRDGKILDENDKAVFNHDIAVKAYQFLADCVHKHKITPAQVVAMTYDDVTDAFKAGRVGMIQEGAHRYADIQKAVGADNLLIAKMPSDDAKRPSPTIVTGWGMGIPRGSKQPEAAWEHLKYYVSSEALEINARVAGTLPSRKSVMERPFFQTPEAAHLRWWADYMAERSEMVINVSTFAQLNEAMVDVLHRLLVEPSVPIKPLLDEAVKKYNQIAGL